MMQERHGSLCSGPKNKWAHLATCVLLLLLLVLVVDSEVGKAAVVSSTVNREIWAGCM
jgi:hypothetical protein